MRGRAPRCRRIRASSESTAWASVAASASASGAGTPRTASVVGPSAEIAKPRRSSAAACSSAAATSSGDAANVAGTSSGCTGTRASGRGLQALVDDPLVRRVHVDEHEAVAILREHVDAVELREREAERMLVAGVRKIGRAIAAGRGRAPKSRA